MLLRPQQLLQVAQRRLAVFKPAARPRCIARRAERCAAGLLRAANPAACQVNRVHGMSVAALAARDSRQFSQARTASLTLNRSWRHQSPSDYDAPPGAAISASRGSAVAGVAGLQSVVPALGGCRKEGPAPAPLCAQHAPMPESTRDPSAVCRLTRPSTRGRPATARLEPVCRLGPADGGRGAGRISTAVLRCSERRRRDENHTRQTAA